VAGHVKYVMTKASHERQTSPSATPPYLILDGRNAREPKLFRQSTWEHIRKFRDFWPRKWIVKSISEADQARPRRCRRRWRDRLNHGGPPSTAYDIDMLPGGPCGVGYNRCTVILDSGIRAASPPGRDLVKALASAQKMGAGRMAIALYCTACCGQAAAARAIRYFQMKWRVGVGLVARGGGGGGGVCGGGWGGVCGAGGWRGGGGPVGYVGAR